MSDLLGISPLVLETLGLALGFGAFALVWIWIRDRPEKPPRQHAE